MSTSEKGEQNYIYTKEWVEYLKRRERKKNIENYFFCCTELRTVTHIKLTRGKMKATSTGEAIYFPLENVADPTAPDTFHHSCRHWHHGLRNNTIIVCGSIVCWSTSVISLLILTIRRNIRSSFEIGHGTLFTKRTNHYSVTCI